MQNLQIRRSYENTTASKIANLVKSGTICLTHEEALEISEKLESLTIESKFNRGFKEKLEFTCNSIIRMLTEIKEGKDVDQVMKEWSVILPKKDAKSSNKEGFILGTSTRFTSGCYFKGNLKVDENGGIGYEQKIFNSEDKEIDYKF